MKIKINVGTQGNTIIGDISVQELAEKLTTEQVLDIYSIQLGGRINKLFQKECSCKEPYNPYTNNCGRCGLPIPQNLCKCINKTYYVNSKGVYLNFCTSCKKPIDGVIDYKPNPIPNAGLRTPDITPPVFKNEFVGATPIYPELNPSSKCEPEMKQRKEIADLLTKRKDMLPHNAMWLAAEIQEIFKPFPSKVEIEEVNFGNTVRLYGDTDEVWHIIEKMENKINELIQTVRKINETTKR